MLLDIARRIYPDVPAVFCNTGLEYPEIQSFVRRHENVDIVVPEMRFPDVIEQYGYPLIGKEVAEAIYYARRIMPSRERERERSADAQSELHRDEHRTGLPCYDDRSDALQHTHNATQTGRDATQTGRDMRKTRSSRNDLQAERFNRTGSGWNCGGCL